METINNSSNLNAYISSVECNKNENSNDFSIKVNVDTVFEPNKKFLLRITEGESSTKNVTTEKELTATGSSNDYVNFENLDFKLDNKYYLWLLDINGSGSTHYVIITSTPDLINVSYILDMEIVKKYGYNYSNSSTGITKIDQKKGDYSNIEFNLIYNHEKEGKEYNFFSIPHDKDPKIDMYPITPKKSWKFNMLTLQGSRRIYNYIKGKTRFMNQYNNKTKILGPYSETVDYKYVFPELRAPKGKKLFSLSDNNTLTLNWYVQNYEKGLFNNVCDEYYCNMYINDKVYSGSYNKGFIKSDELSKDLPVIQVSSCFAYDPYNASQFGKKVTRNIILIVPKILLIECHIINDSFSLDISWDTKVEIGQIKQIKLIVNSNDSLIKEEYCNFNEGKTSFENLNLDPNKSYTVETLYYIKDEGGIESEGKMSPPIEIISRYPKDFRIEYKENLSLNDLNSQLNEEYCLVGNWDNGSLSKEEYIEIQYKNNQDQTIIINSDPITTPPLQINDTTIIQARICKRTTNSIGPWSKEVTVPFMGISKYDFDHAGRLLKADLAVTATEIQTNHFEYDGRGNILSKEIIQNKNQQLNLKIK